MTNEQILKKAIDKAEKNGWNSEGEHDFDKDFADYHNSPEIIIYRHDFAEKFWGEENTPQGYFNPKKKRGAIYSTKSNPAWEHHLKIMVLAKKPLKYIKKFL